MHRDLARYYAADAERREDQRRRQDAHDRALQRERLADQYGDDYNDPE